MLTSKTCRSVHSMAANIALRVLRMCLLFALSAASTLPPNWVACRTGNGREYYFNNVTGSSQWELPSQSIPLEEVTAIPVLPRGYHRRSFYSKPPSASALNQSLLQKGVTEQNGAEGTVPQSVTSPPVSEEVITVAEVNETVLLDITVASEPENEKGVPKHAELPPPDRAAAAGRIAPRLHMNATASANDSSMQDRTKSQKDQRSLQFQHTGANNALSKNALSKSATNTSDSTTEAGSRRTWMQTAQNTYTYAKSWWKRVEAGRKAQEARKQGRLRPGTSVPPSTGTPPETTTIVEPEPQRGNEQRRSSVFGVTKLVAGKRRKRSIEGPATTVRPAAHPTGTEDTTASRNRTDESDRSKLASLESARATQVATIRGMEAQLRKLEVELRVQQDQQEKEESLRRAMETNAQLAALQAAEHARRERDEEERSASDAAVQSAELLERLVAGLDVLQQLRDESELTTAQAEGMVECPPEGAQSASHVAEALAQNIEQDMHVAAVMAQACVLLHQPLDTSHDEALSSDNGSAAPAAAEIPARWSRENEVVRADEEVRKWQAEEAEEQRDRLQREIDALRRELAQCCAENAVLRHELSIASTLLCSLRGQPLYPTGEQTEGAGRTESAPAGEMGVVGVIRRSCRRLWDLWHRES